VVGVMVGAGRSPAMSVAELHRQWLELVDIEGPFLAVPVLKRVWPNGIPDFRTTHPERFDALVDARSGFEAAWEAFDRDPGSDAALEAYRSARDAWVETVLCDVVGWAESMRWGPVPGVEAQSPNRAVTVTAQAALHGADGVVALVHVVDPTDSLRQTPADLWAATPVDRLEALLRASNVEIGMVTDGRWFGLVCAADGRMTASGIVDALTWIEEPRTRDAFLTLLGRQHLIGGDPKERLSLLFAESVAAAEEITEALGAQVRRAVELLIQSFSESATEALQRGEIDPLPTRTHDIYEAAVTVMMRTVFLLFAEERALLPSGELFEQGYGILGELDRLAARELDEGEHALDATSLTWHRLLATSQALFRGASFENLRMPAYGGSLFDPDRFPFLTAATEHGTSAITVSDRVMLHVLRAVQVAIVRGEARQISFRDMDVEQIGYIYEGLLGYTCATVNETVLGLIGTTGAEPEIPLARLEALAAANLDPKQLATAIREWIADDQPSAKAPTVAAIAKAVQAEADPSIVSALAHAVGDDKVLRDRITPWLGLVRRDLRDCPLVVLAGGLLVEETPSRRTSGAHYTPKALAEEVVTYSLQPLCYLPGPYQTADETAWKLKPSDELLDLKVADIACGSGAFLVAAARYLAERVVEAWMGEGLANAARKDLPTRAMRSVVANCLYGADINDMAVEMCKLSLWLVSLDRDLPFSFVDDKVFVGNSLLGITRLEQLRKLHIDPSAASTVQKLDLFDVDVDAIIRRAVHLRERLATEIDDNDPARSSAAKHRQLTELTNLTTSLHQMADGVIAAGLPLGGKPGNVLNVAYEDLRLAVTKAFPNPKHGDADSTWLNEIIQSGLTPTVPTDYEHWEPLHWVLEAPDVILERGGFDAIVGNPPFLGGSKLSGCFGSDIRDFLVNVVAHGSKGLADLVAYFFLRSIELLSVNGTLGLIATSTIAQGDTRSTGLDRMAEAGFTIVRAVRSRPWPSASANLEYAAVWGSVGKISDDTTRVLDDRPVSAISTLLEDTDQVGARLPVPLAENGGLIFKGVFPMGTGFMLNAIERERLISENENSRDMVFPFLNGKDLNSRPDSSPSRWIIDLAKRSLDEAEQYTAVMAHLRRNVLPYRSTVKRKAGRERWWRYGEWREGLHAAMENRDRVIVLPQTSNTMQPVIVPTSYVLDQTLIVIISDDAGMFAFLASTVHYLWAQTYSLYMRSDLRYTVSEVFAPLPLPVFSVDLRHIGQVLDRERTDVMLRRGLGLTRLYNLVNDPAVGDSRDSDVARLRAVHVEIDQAVMQAYNWSDIPLDHGFYSYRQVKRWTVSPAARVEILDRLLAENRRRSAAEADGARRGPKGRSSKKVPSGTKPLFP
jgi:hypothetical protein